MHLRSSSFTDTDLHIHIGAPIAFGVTLNAVPPSAVTRFRGLAGAEEVDSRAASEHLAAALRGETAELATARYRFEVQLRTASTDLADARRLAAAPVCGGEPFTIHKMVASVDEAIRSLPAPSARVERLRRLLPAAQGLDADLIGLAMRSYDDETAAIAQLRNALIEVRDGLLEAERVASDPATLAGIAKIRTNVKLARAVTPERVAHVERLLELIKATLVELDSELTAIKRAAA